MSKTFKQTHTAYLLDYGDAEVEVEYSVAPYFPATLEQPEEGGDIELVNITHNGQDCWECLRDHERERLADVVGWNHEDDALDCDAERDRRIDDRLTGGPA